jgi:hypothetical protein
MRGGVVEGMRGGTGEDVGTEAGDAETEPWGGGERKGPCALSPVKGRDYNE